MRRKPYAKKSRYAQRFQPAKSSSMPSSAFTVASSGAGSRSSAGRPWTASAARSAHPVRAVANGASSRQKASSSTTNHRCPVSKCSPSRTNGKSAGSGRTDRNRPQKVRYGSSYAGSAARSRSHWGSGHSTTVPNTRGTPRRTSRSRANRAEPRRRTEWRAPSPATRNSMGMAHTTPNPASTVTAPVVVVFFT